MNMKALSMEEMSQVNGGEVVYDDSYYWTDGYYWTVSDDGMILCPDPFHTVEEAQQRAREWGWNADFVTHEEFERRMGFPFDLDDFY